MADRNPAIKCVKPRGAFYLFPDISELLGGELKTSSDFAQRLIEQEHVALTPGEGFDAPGTCASRTRRRWSSSRKGDADPAAGREPAACKGGRLTLEVRAAETRRHRENTEKFGYSVSLCLCGPWL
jgi:hypothetical protein